MRNKSFIAIFIIFLFLPILGNVFDFDFVEDLYEKRQLSTRPSLKLSILSLDLGSYPKKFDQYYNDNYGFRKSLITFNGVVMDKIFDESLDDRVLFGKDGWLFFDNEQSLLDSAGRAKISEELVGKGVDVFYQNWQEAKRRGIKYLLVIAADKTNIYKEFLPDYFQYDNSKHRIDVFVKALLKKYPNFPLIDLRPILLKAKQNEIVYHKTDTHWNKRGAHYGYVEIINNLGLKPYLRKDFQETADQEFHGDISQIMGSKQTNKDFNLVKKFKSDLYFDATETQQLKEIFHKISVYKNDKSLPKLFVYGDSFFTELKDLVSEHFSNSIYVTKYPCRIDYDILKNYSPDYLIQEFWENRIEMVLKNC